MLPEKEWLFFPLLFIPEYTIIREKAELFFHHEWNCCTLVLRHSSACFCSNWNFQFDFRFLFFFLFYEKLFFQLSWKTFPCAQSLVAVFTDSTFHSNSLDSIFHSSAHTPSRRLLKAVGWWVWGEGRKIIYDSEKFFFHSIRVFLDSFLASTSYVRTHFSHFPFLLDEQHCLLLFPCPRTIKFHVLRSSLLCFSIPSFFVCLFVWRIFFCFLSCCSSKKLINFLLESIEFLIFFSSPYRQTKPEWIEHAIRNADATKGKRWATVTLVSRHNAPGPTRTVQILTRIKITQQTPRSRWKSSKRVEPDK